MTRPHSSLDLLLDCDGVLLDWVGGFIGFASKALGREPDPAGPDSFDLTGWMGCDTATYFAMVNDFNEGADGSFGRLTPLPGSVDALQAAASQGRKISIITACSTLPRVIAQREQNLRDVYGDIFHEIHAVDLRQSKEELLRRYKDVFWVEDKSENAVLGAEIGHKSYLIRSSHNLADEARLSHPRMTWVDGWGCIRSAEALH